MGIMVTYPYPQFDKAEENLSQRNEPHVYINHDCITWKPQYICLYLYSNRRSQWYIFWTDVLVKVSKFLRQKMSRPEGTRTPNRRIHAECCNNLSYQGQTFAVTCSEYWLRRYRYNFQVKLTSEMLTVRGQQHSFSTHERKLSKFLRQKMCRPEGDSNPQPSDSCRMLLPFELSGPEIFCPMFLNTSSGGIDIF